ncbi:hypothetical protein CesoFtcFv8_027319 [Champsocephalus esox]|uniref:Major facilitator superfamily (MFS) profile domain-containing protein n=1 Tax=Champsocephalus esox TaxID=159716 RepID=A0AAN7Y7B1_9TELE|nr:hypothetical protein CesoFtcFv8_027319 [Champsocephalus esox]
MSPLQISLYCRLSLIFFFTSFLFFLDIFTAAIVAETCPHGNGTDVNQSEAGTESGKTDSVCDWTDLLAYGQTLFMVGLLLGSLVGGALSDRYGKRPVLLVCVCLHAFCGLVPAVFPQPIVFLAVRCVTGVCCCCINICSFSLGNSSSLTPPLVRADADWTAAGLTADYEHVFRYSPADRANKATSDLCWTPVWVPHILRNLVFYQK